MAIKHKTVHASTQLFKPSTNQQSPISSKSATFKRLKAEMKTMRNNYLGHNNNQLISQKVKTGSQKSLPQQIIIRNFQKQVLLRKQLYLILHACHCKTSSAGIENEESGKNSPPLDELFGDNSNKSTNATVCNLEGCGHAKKQIEHLVNCKNSSNCGVANCASFKQTALHYKQCHKMECSLCGPAIMKYNQDDSESGNRNSKDA